MNIDELIENFELLDDWEDKYRYLIDLGSALPPLPAEYQTESWKVSGCQSQVWLVPEFVKNGADCRVNFRGDSDAAIVKGLIAVVLTIFNGKTPAEILQTDMPTLLHRLGLEEHLSPSRRNGLGSMIEKIRFYAQSV